MTPQQTKTAGTAIASLVLGILGISCLGPLAAIPAVICGHVAWSQIKRSSGTLQGQGLAIAGLVLGYLGIVLVALMTALAIPAVVKARDTAQRMQCVNNLRMIDMAKEQWALVNAKENGTPVDESSLKEYMLGGSAPTCPKGGAYTYNAIGQAPECSVHGPPSATLRPAP